MWVGCICTVMLLASIASSFQNFKRHESTSAAEARHQATLLADQVGRSVRSLDRALFVIAQRVHSDGLDFFERGEGSQLLRELALTVPLETIFWVFLPNGSAIASSRDISGKHVSITDRDYYKLAQKADETEIVIGNPVIGRISRANVVPLAHSVRAPNGDLVAIVSSSLMLSSVQEAYSGFLSNGLNSIALRRSDTGNLIFNIPDDAGLIAPPPIAENERAFAYQQIDGYPLLAVSSVHSGTWMERWKSETFLQVIWLSIGWTLCALIYYAIVRRVKADQAHNHQLQMADAAKSQFLAAANHDLRQPIQAMRLYWEVLAASEATSKHPALAQLGEALSAAEELLHSLLQVSVLKSGIIEPHIEPVQISDIITQICSSMQKDADTKSVEIIHVKSSIKLATDRELIRQMIKHLLGNSIKYTNFGRILIGCRLNSSGCAIEVLDTGIGIPANKIDDIFSEFVQLGNTERDRSKGLGLGLSIVRNTAAILGYSVTARSIFGQGSHFMINIPAEFIIQEGDEQHKRPE